MPSEKTEHYAIQKFIEIDSSAARRVLPTVPEEIIRDEYVRAKEFQKIHGRTKDQYQRMVARDREKISDFEKTLAVVKDLVKTSEEQIERLKLEMNQNSEILVLESQRMMPVEHHIEMLDRELRIIAEIKKEGQIISENDNSFSCLTDEELKEALRKIETLMGKLEILMNDPAAPYGEKKSSRKKWEDCKNKWDALNEEMKKRGVKHSKTDFRADTSDNSSQKIKNLRYLIYLMKGIIFFVIGSMVCLMMKTALNITDNTSRSIEKGQDCLDPIPRLLNESDESDAGSDRKITDGTDPISKLPYEVERTISDAKLIHLRMLEKGMQTGRVSKEELKKTEQEIGNAMRRSLIAINFKEDSSGFKRSESLFMKLLLYPIGTVA